MECVANLPTAFAHGDVIVPVTAAPGHWAPLVGKRLLPVFFFFCFFFFFFFFFFCAVQQNLFFLRDRRITRITFWFFFFEIFWNFLKIYFNVSLFDGRWWIYLFLLIFYVRCIHIYVFMLLCWITTF